MRAEKVEICRHADANSLQIPTHKSPGLNTRLTTDWPSRASELASEIERSNMLVVVESSWIAGHPAFEQQVLVSRVLTCRSRGVCQHLSTHIGTKSKSKARARDADADADVDPETSKLDHCCGILRLWLKNDAMIYAI